VTDYNRKSDRLPVEHPVDADWRFSCDSAIELSTLALAAADTGDLIAHIGTHSTFLRCVLGAGEQRHMLLDQNTSVLDAFEARGIGSPHIMLGADIRAVHRLRLGAAAAIVDPPWYLDDTLLFLNLAAEVCRPGAPVLLCQPMTGTRPGVASERDALLAALPDRGLALVAVRSGAVRYVTPHFEVLSLRAALGDVPVPSSWRRGDLLTLERTTAARGHALQPVTNQTWREVTFGPVRIKLRLQETGDDLGQLVVGDVLTNVSRRDPTRERIGLWTSGNRVFTLRSPQHIGDLIKLCETDLMRGQFSLERTIFHALDVGATKQVATRLFELLQLELHEHGGIQ
jgi:hypothetical protein